MATRPDKSRNATIQRHNIKNDEDRERIDVDEPVSALAEGDTPDDEGDANGDEREVKRSRKARPTGMNPMKLVMRQSLLLCLRGKDGGADFG